MRWLSQIGSRSHSSTNVSIPTSSIRLRQFLIRLCPLESFVLILNTGGSALQDQRGDPLRVIDGHPECQPAAHRVAQPGSSRDAELRRDLGEVVQSLLEHIT